MMITGLGISLLGIHDPLPFLNFARGVASVMGGLAVIFSFLLARRWFGTSVGLISCLLLAGSPYFLSFSRFGFTEGDAFCAPFVLLLLLCYERYRQQRSQKGALFTGLSAGLVVASKFTLLSLLPAILLYEFLESRSLPPLENPPNSEKKTGKSVLAFSIPLLFCIAAWFCFHFFPKLDLGGFHVFSFFWFLALCLSLFQAFRPREARLITSPFLFSYFFAIMALSSFFIFIPTHIFTPEIWQEIWKDFSTNRGTLPFSAIWPTIRLFGGILLFKSGLPLGIFITCSLFWGALKSSGGGPFRIIIFLLLSFAVTLFYLPLRQTFYLMPIFPLLLILVSALIHRLWYGIKMPAIRASGRFAVVLSFAWLSYGLVRVYPDFNLYGLETIGTELWGHSTLGYRGILQVTYDGSIEALVWYQSHIGRERKILFTPPDNRIPYSPELTSLNQSNLGLIESIQKSETASFDYLLISTYNTDFSITPEWQSTLDAHFSAEPIFTVWRGHGAYRIPVVRIFEKRHPRT